MRHGTAAVVRPLRADGRFEPEPSIRRRSRPRAQVGSSPTCIYTSRQFRTRFSLEECRGCLEAHVLPTQRRFALQLRWRLPPADREVTGGVTATGFVLRRTLPVYAYEPALWGRFEPIAEGTRIWTYFVTGGSQWVIVTGPSPRSWSFIHRLVDRLWVWLTLGVVAAASIVEGWRAAEHEAFLLGFLTDVLGAEEIS